MGKPGKIAFPVILVLGAITGYITYTSFTAATPQEDRIDSPYYQPLPQPRGEMSLGGGGGGGAHNNKVEEELHNNKVEEELLQPEQAPLPSQYFKAQQYRRAPIMIQTRHRCLLAIR